MKKRWRQMLMILLVYLLVAMFEIIWHRAIIADPSGIGWRLYRYESPTNGKAPFRGGIDVWGPCIVCGLVNGLLLARHFSLKAWAVSSVANSVVVIGLLPLYATCLSVRPPWWWPSSTERYVQFIPMIIFILLVSGGSVLGGWAAFVEMFGPPVDSGAKGDRTKH